MQDSMVVLCKMHLIKYVKYHTVTKTANIELWIFQVWCEIMNPIREIMNAWYQNQTEPAKDWHTSFSSSCSVDKYSPHYSTEWNNRSWKWLHPFSLQTSPEQDPTSKNRSTSHLSTVNLPLSQRKHGSAVEGWENGPKTRTTPHRRPRGSVIHLCCHISRIVL